MADRLMTENWYSDTALEKQKEADRRIAAGEPITTDIMLGMYQPRTQPRADERCRCCESDARSEAGGDGQYCYLCLSRGHNE